MVRALEKEKTDEGDDRGKSDLVQLVLKDGLPVAYKLLDATIERRGEQAYEIACQLRANKASDGEALKKKGELVSAVEAEIAAQLRTSVDEARLERLSADVTQKRQERDGRSKEKRDAERKLFEAERELVVAGGGGRTPKRSGIFLMAFLLASLFAAVLSPSVPVLVPGLKEVPGAQAWAFLLGLFVGLTMVGPSFYAALYSVDEFIVRHGSAVAGLLVVLGIGLIRRFQLGEWNEGVIGLIVVEGAVVLFVEVIAAVIRARFRDGVSSLKAQQQVDQSRREVAAATEAERVADESLEKYKKLFDDEEHRVDVIRELVSRRESYIQKGSKRVQERFATGFAV